MKVAVVGSREGFTYEQVRDYLLDNLEVMDIIVSGGARGVDSHAAYFCKELWRELIVIRPDNPNNPYDYIKRNYKIVDMSDRIICFWDGKSRGTKSVIEYAQKVGKIPTVILPYKNLASGYLRVKYV